MKRGLRAYTGIAALLLVVMVLAFTACPREEDSLTVTFSANGGSGTVPKPISADEYSQIQIPGHGDLTKSGYAFGGWNTSSSGNGTNYIAGSSYYVTEDITLYANWITAFTVSFSAPGATNGTAPAPIRAVYGSSIQLPEKDDLERTGYVFTGWNTDSYGNGTSYSAGSSYTVTGNITLYAGWVPIRTVTFDANGATSGTPPTAMKEGSGFNIVLPGQGNLTKTGYLFAGWNTSIFGTGTSYYAGSSYTVTDNITLYAKWGVPCTVTFNANGGANAPGEVTAGEGAGIQLPGQGSMTRSGYSFDGWNTSSSGSGTNYSVNALYIVTGDATLYAKWIVIPPGSIRVRNTGNSSIIRLVVSRSGGGTFASYGTGYSPFIVPYESYTISNVPAGTYTVSATYFSTGTNTRTTSSAVTVTGGSTTSVSFN